MTARSEGMSSRWFVLLAGLVLPPGVLFAVVAWSAWDGFCFVRARGPSGGDGFGWEPWALLSGPRDSALEAVRLASPAVKRKGFGSCPFDRRATVSRIGRKSNFASSSGSGLLLVPRRTETSVTRCSEES